MALSNRELGVFWETKFYNSIFRKIRLKSRHKHGLTLMRKPRRFFKILSKEFFIHIFADMNKFASYIWKLRIYLLQVTKSVLSLLKYYNWQKFAIIYEEARESVAKSLETEAKKRNMTINDIKCAGDKHKCCERNLPCCQGVYWYQIIKETMNRTRSKLIITHIQLA